MTVNFDFELWTVSSAAGVGDILFRLFCQAVLIVNAVVAKCSTWDRSLKTTLKLLFFEPAKVVLKEVLEGKKCVKWVFQKIWS